MNEIKEEKLTIDAETGILVSLLFDKNTYYRYKDRLTEEILPGQFSKEFFKTYKRQIENGREPDVFTMESLLPDRFDKDLERLSDIYMDSPEVTTDPESYLTFLREKYERQLVTDLLLDANMKITRGAFAQEVVSELIRDLENIGHADSKLIKIKESITGVIKAIDYRLQSGGKITGIPSGFREYDTFANGLQNSDLVVVAGETSQGKTSLAITMANNQGVDYDVNSLFISLEMSDTQLAARMMAQRAGVNSKLLLSGMPDSGTLQQMHSGISKLVDAPIWIDNHSTTDLDEIISVIHTAKQKHGIEVVYVDYLQLVTTKGRGESKEAETAKIARTFKNTAKKLNIPIVLISQLSRDKTNPKPTLGRLRGSGQIEEAADVVWFVWRPDFYGIETINLINGNLIDSTGNAHAIIAKGRNIGTTDFVLGWEPNLTLFSDHAPGNTTQMPVNNSFDDISPDNQNTDVPF